MRSEDIISSYGNDSDRYSHNIVILSTVIDTYIAFEYSSDSAVGIAFIDASKSSPMIKRLKFR